VESALQPRPSTQLSSAFKNLPFPASLIIKIYTLIRMRLSLGWSNHDFSRLSIQPRLLSKDGPVPMI
jgi:hypothetical protein